MAQRILFTNKYVANKTVGMLGCRCDQMEIDLETR